MDGPRERAESRPMIVLTSLAVLGLVVDDVIRWLERPTRGR